MFGRNASGCAGIAFALLCASAAHAAIITSDAEVLHDLTSGGSVIINGAIYSTTNQQPTGSGVIRSFVRVSAANQNQVEGYNTDGRPLQFDENNSATFTRSQTLSSMATQMINGVEYVKFLLDINQQAANPLLTLNEVEIHLGNAADLLNYDPNVSEGGTAFGANATFVYDLDLVTDNAVDLNYNLNSGSGSGDMHLYVPRALFTGPNDFVYLYSKFGIPNPNNDGYEEWATVVGPRVPEPSAILGGALMGALLSLRRRRTAR
jgi:hypothetical protein